MSDNTLLHSALWNAYQDNATQFRHHETERSAVATAIAAIAAAVIGLVTYDNTIQSPADVPPSFFLIGLGVFGASFSYKQYERSQFHYARLRKFRAALDALFSDAPLNKGNNDAKSDHNFPTMKKLSLHHWWIALHLLISLVGVALLVMALHKV